MRVRHFRLRSIRTSLEHHAPLSVATTLALGALAAMLAISSGAPAFAGRPHQGRHGPQAQAQKLDVNAAGKRKGNKTKTVKKTFTSNDAITIPALGADVTNGPADPYPSMIAVSGFKKARITDLNLTLRGFSHEFTRDVDVLLVAPGGRNAVVMGDVGGFDDDAQGATDLTITLDDEAAVPLSTADDIALTSGTFRPLDNFGLNDVDDPDEPSLSAFPEPAPEASGKSALSAFDGVDPNGQWRLFVLDDTEFDAGAIAGGWTLEITAKSKGKNKGNGKKRR